MFRGTTQNISSRILTPTSLTMSRYLLVFVPPFSLQTQELRSPTNLLQSCVLGAGSDSHETERKSFLIRKLRILDFLEQILKTRHLAHHKNYAVGPQEVE